MGIVEDLYVLDRRDGAVLSATPAGPLAGTNVLAGDTANCVSVARPELQARHRDTHRSWRGDECRDWRRNQ